MKKIKYFIIAFLVFVLLPQDNYSQKVGSTSMQFLKVMPCARATALGDAYSVWASGAEAVFWNPAGIVFVQGNEISMTYIKWIFDTQQGAVSYATSLGDLGYIGFQIQYVDFGTIDEAIWGPPYSERSDFPYLTGRTFRPFSYLAGFTYASKLTDKFQTGLSVKYAHESLYNGKKVNALIDNTTGATEEVKTWANTVLFDFGIRYVTGFRTIEIAASMQNFGPSITYAKETNNNPMSLRVGIAADFLGTDALLFSDDDNRLGVAFELFQPNDYTQQTHLGVEYEFAKIIALRVGYKFNYDADGFTAGGGVKHNLGTMRLSLDYSFGALSYHLGNVHRISLGVGY